MCAPPFATKQRPPIWKILDPPLISISISFDLLMMTLHVVLLVLVILLLLEKLVLRPCC